MWSCCGVWCTKHQSTRIHVSHMTSTCSILLDVDKSVCGFANPWQYSWSFKTNRDNSVIDWTGHCSSRTNNTEIRNRRLFRKIKKCLDSHDIQCNYIVIELIHIMIELIHIMIELIHIMIQLNHMWQSTVPYLLFYIFNLFYFSTLLSLVFLV